MDGTIFNIQKACLSDGPGIRTTVFLKGCPLRCVWCHNPESQRGVPELSYAAEHCTGCGRCIALCPVGCHRMENGRHMLQHSTCLGCGKCVGSGCGNLELFGHSVSAADVIATVMEDSPFYGEDGGMTLSGGEPLFQPAFCMELLRLGKEKGLHICMETCGFADKSLVAESTEYTDLYLFDCKETDPERHKAYTGVELSQILLNLELLDSRGSPIVLRCPLIPGYNTREGHFRGIAALANRLTHLVRIETEPYHAFGIQKYSRIGREYCVNPATNAPTDEDVAAWNRCIARYTDVPVARA